jgi:hypothetical protein
MSASNGAPLLPDLILSGRPFLGSSSVSKQADLDCMVRFSKPENVVSLVTAAAARGVNAIAPMNHPALLDALDVARAGADLRVYPVIPNVVGYVRDATDYGMIGAGVRHVRRLAIADLLGIGVRGVVKLPGVLKRDFRTLLSILVEVEMAAFKKLRPPLVLLHPQMTDIAVALGNHEALRVFADVVQRRYRARAGVVTNNFGALVRMLDGAKIDLPVIVAPFNRRGFLMKPTRSECEALLRTSGRTIVADRITAGGVEPLDAAFAHLADLGIRSAVVDVTSTADLDAVVASRRGDSVERRAVPALTPRGWSA